MNEPTETNQPPTQQVGHKRRVSLQPTTLELTDSDKRWMQIFRDNVDQFDRVVTWHLSKRLGMKTTTCNYHLSKLADKGLLVKEAVHRTCTIFKLAS